ncbi:MAG: sensor histidine kinase [Hyphomicrobiaceae bacterium]
MPADDHRQLHGITGEMLGRFNADRLVHELRTPLAAIQSMAEALASGHLGRMENERHAGYVLSMAETAKHALAVLEAMLVQKAENARHTDELPVEIDACGLARATVEGMLILAARAGVRLELRESSPPILAKVRATDVRQMLINLIANGIAHAGGGSTVLIDAGLRDQFVWLRVTDDGAGIPQSVIDRLEMGLPLDNGGGFPTSRLRLGLTLTRALAITNGGGLEIKTSPAGTEACIILPAVQASAAVTG